MFRYIYIVLLLAIVVGGCSETVSTDSHSVIMPLKEGNAWVYIYTTYDSAGNVKLILKQDSFYLGLPITKGSEHWYPAFYPLRINQSDTTFYVNKSDGLWETYFSLSHLKYKYPTSTNDTFDVTLVRNWPAPGVIEKSFTETVSASESISIPLGTFTCIHYRVHEQHIDSATMVVTDDTNMGDDYVSPGIGLIKSVGEYSRLTGPPDSLRLERYHQEIILLKYTLQ